MMATLDSAFIASAISNIKRGADEKRSVTLSPSEARVLWEAIVELIELADKMIVHE